MEVSLSIIFVKYYKCLEHSQAFKANIIESREAILNNSSNDYSTDGNPTKPFFMLHQQSDYISDTLQLSGFKCN